MPDSCVIDAVDDIVTAQVGGRVVDDGVDIVTHVRQDKLQVTLGRDICALNVEDEKRGEDSGAGKGDAGVDITVATRRASCTGSSQVVRMVAIPFTTEEVSYGICRHVLRKRHIDCVIWTAMALLQAFVRQ